MVERNPNKFLAADGSGHPTVDAARRHEAQVALTELLMNVVADYADPKEATAAIVRAICERSKEFAALLRPLVFPRARQAKPAARAPGPRRNRVHRARVTSEQAAAE